MGHWSLEVHAGYGAVPRDGDHVEPGDVLGLSTDALCVVRSPVAGSVHVSATEGESGRAVILDIVADRRPCVGAPASA